MDMMLAVTFEEDNRAYEALSKFKELDGQGQIDLTAAAIVVRAEDGHIDTKDMVGDSPIEGTATGGLIGLVIGILCGPLGVLLGGATGLLAGSLWDVSDEDYTDSALTELSRSVKPGRTTLLAEVEEQSNEVLDAAMSGLGGTIVRRPRYEVEDEIATAEEAQRKAKSAARKELNEHKREQAKEKIDAKVEELKAKVHHQQPVAAGKS